MDKSAHIFVAGHNGLVGSALCRELRSKGYQNLITCPRSELDLRDATKVDQFLGDQRVEYIFFAAAKVGGIKANQDFPVDFLCDNALMTMHTFQAALKHKVRKVLFVASSCAYPKDAEQPFREESLLTGLPEPTNEAFALSKILGIRLCDYIRKQYGASFISVVPASLYGPRDQFDPEKSHVIPAMIRRIYEARVKGLPELVMWGTGTPLREFLYVDDLARALMVLMNEYDEPGPINVGSGAEISISQLATLTQKVVGYKGQIRFDTSYRDGMMRKVVDPTRMKKFQWSPQVNLEEGLNRTFEWALENKMLETKG